LSRDPRGTPRNLPANAGILSNLMGRYIMFEINKIEIKDVPAAMAALEKTSAQEDKDETGLKNLNTHAKKMSARAVVEAYKKDQPKTKDDFIRFIQNLPHRFSRVGFTGEPYSEVNSLLAQIAWSCEPGSQEMFWKILYPEITGVIDGDANTQWPRYGEAILSESLAQKTPGPILNYRQLWKKAETAPIELIEETKVSGFCPAHRDYWLKVVTRRKNGSSNHPESKLVFKTEFSNYYEFFDSMRAFMEKYNSQKNTKWDASFATTSEGIQVLLDFRAYQEIVLNAPKTLREIFKSIDQLPAVLSNVVGEISNGRFSANIGQSCFHANGLALKNILEKNEVQKVLSEIHFAPKSIAPPEKKYAPLIGHDALLYLPEHAEQLGALSEDSLIELIKRHEAHGLALNVLVELCRPALAASAHPAKKLFNLVYQIYDMKIRSEFIRLAIGQPLNFNNFIQGEDMEEGIYGLKLIDFLDAPESEKSKLAEDLRLFISKILDELSEMSSQLVVMNSFTVPLLICFLEKHDKRMNEMNALIKRRFHGLENFQQKVSLLKSKLNKFCGQLNYFDFLNRVREDVISAIIKSPLPHLNDRKATRQHEVLMGMLIGKWILTNKNLEGNFFFFSILGLVEKYEKVPNIRQMIENQLYSDRIYRYLASGNLNHWWLAFNILRKRNYFDTHEKISKMVKQFHNSDPDEPMKNDFISWLKQRENYVMNSDEFFKVLLQTIRYNLLYHCVVDSFLFDLFSNELHFIKTYNDYIKVSAILSEQQRRLLTVKTSEFIRPADPLLHQDLDCVTEVIPLYYLLDFALDHEKSRDTLADYCLYFKNELARLLRCENVDYSVLFNTYSSRGYKPENIFMLLFDKIVKIYGFDEAMKNLSPLFVSYLSENPSKLMSLMIRSEHRDQVCDYLSGKNPKPHSEPSSMISAPTQHPLMLSQSQTGGREQMDLHTETESRKCSSPD
jgi:hypothetical protein